MAVIPESQLSLMRKRCQLNEYMQAGDWSQVLALETTLFADIDVAAQDPHRASGELLKELGRVVGVYRALSDACCSYGDNHSGPQSGKNAG